MDDGSKSRGAAYLNTQQFDRESQDKLIDALEKQCGIRATLNRDKKYFRLRIAVRSIPTFHQLVARFVLPLFACKLAVLGGACDSS